MIRRPCLVAVLTAFLVISGASPSPAQTAPTASAGQPSDFFRAQWPALRTALLSGNNEQLAALTRVPLEVRGVDDSIPIRKITEDKLALVIDQVLSQDSGTSLRERVTNRTLVERLSDIDRTTRAVSMTDKVSRVGPFQFQKMGPGWKLVRVYLEED